MKVSINIVGVGQVFVSGSPDVVNRKALCRELGLCNVAFSRLEKQHGFDYTVNYLMAKKKNKA